MRSKFLCFCNESNFHHFVSTTKIKFFAQNICKFTFMPKKTLNKQDKMYETFFYETHDKFYYQMRQHTPTITYICTPAKKVLSSSLIYVICTQSVLARCNNRCLRFFARVCCCYPLAFIVVYK